jgi:hypothetical protein
MAGWQSGHAAACKAVYAGSIPTSASIAKIEQAPMWRFFFVIEKGPALSGGLLRSVLSRNFGVEDIAVELPCALNLLDDKYLAIAFGARGLLSLGYDAAMRVRAHIAEVTANL